MVVIGSLIGAVLILGHHVIIGVLILAMAMVRAAVLVAVRKRVKSTFWNVGYIINEMKSGRPAYMGKEELDVHNPKALGLPHGAVIAVGTLFYLALAAHYVG